MKIIYRDNDVCRYENGQLGICYAVVNGERMYRVASRAELAALGVL